MRRKPLSRMTDDELLDELRHIGRALDDVNGARDGYYARRRAVFEEGRRREPPLWFRVMGEAAGVGEVAVIAALREKE